MSVRVITSDKEALRENVARSTARKSASELARGAWLRLVRGENRGIVAAGEMVRRNHQHARGPELIRVPAERGPQITIGLISNQSATESEAMSTVSVDNQYEWRTVAHEWPRGLEIILLKRTYVLPWSQFLYQKAVTMKSGSCSLHKTFASGVADSAPCYRGLTE